MLNLRTLGGLSLQSDSGQVSASAHQRRKLALLALLAAHPSGISRDRIVLLLWPESGEASGRRVLAQTLYASRRALSVADLVIDEAGTLRLNPDVITSDLHALRLCTERNDLAGAARLYGGSFLDGFHLPNAVEFDRWADGERLRLLRQQLRTIDALAVAATASGNLAEAVRWRREAATLDHYSTPLVVELVDALTLAGDRAGALDAARLHAALLRSDLDLEPDAGLAAAVTRAERGPVATHPWDIQAVAIEPPTSALAASGSASEPRRESISSDGFPIAHASRYRFVSKHAALLGGLAAAAVVMLGLFRARAAPEASGGSSERLLVLPFVADDSLGRTAADGLSDLLRGTLDGVGSIVTVSERAYDDPGRTTSWRTQVPGIPILARRHAAALVLTGKVVRSGNRLRVIAELYDTTHSFTPIARAQAEGFDADLFTLSDRIASLLIAGRLGVREGDLVQSASVTTTSSAALHDYLRAEADYRALRFADAMTNLRQAVAADSTFALAYYRMATTADWLNLGAVELQAIDAALGYDARLRPHDRSLVAAYHAFAHRQVQTAELRYEAILRAYPDDIEARLMAAEIAFHFGSASGQPFALARQDYERVLALDPWNVEAMLHLVRIAASQRRVAELDSLVTRIQGIDPTTPELRESEALGASLHRDTVRLAALIAASRDAPDELDDMARALAQFTGDYAWAERAFRARAASLPRTLETRTSEIPFIADVEYAAGSRRAADQEVRMDPVLDDPDALVARGIAALVPEPAVMADSANALADSLWSAPGRLIRLDRERGADASHVALSGANGRERLWPIAALLDARAGRAARAQAHANTLLSAGATMTGELDRRTAGLLLAIAQLGRGDSAAALRSLEALPQRVELTTGLEMWLRGALLASAHRDREARRAYAAVSTGHVFDEILVPWTFFRRAALARRDGDAATADTLRARGASLLSHGDLDVIAAIPPP